MGITLDPQKQSLGDSQNLSGSQVIASHAISEFQKLLRCLADSENQIRLLQFILKQVVESSSNPKEFQKQIEALEKEAKQKLLNGELDFSWWWKDGTCVDDKHQNLGPPDWDCLASSFF